MTVRIYTRKGDQGTTSLRLGERVPKEDERIEVNGQIDELNARLGMAKAMLREQIGEEGTYGGEIAFINSIQSSLMAVMAYIAASGQEPLNEKLYEDFTAEMERRMDQLTTMPAFHFDLPGRNSVNAAFHLARTQARTAERRLWGLSSHQEINPVMMQFFNRLSDYLFILAVSVKG
ncbi:cob(I)yrinic acid a,c-diamide adenosyltransferase [Prevotella sp. AGR2160]|uniref:cob(I)yrinic acid a,c-diamide adenosyltransferase n=1 Tax=Prevotella sp. AGR2160 TaxID=1280674 RepID=UPI0012DE0A04|nr:cob(I)yrinic acid a,c-diamide adenosyltransferase [Prevotella sp. AGR2160]